MDAKSLEDKADRLLNRKQYREAAELFLKAALNYELALQQSGPER